MSDTKRNARRLAVSLTPLGLLAAAAGCSGGSGTVAPRTAATPTAAPVGAPIAANAQRVTAQLTVQIPARGVKKSARRVQYISPGSGAIGVRIVPVPAPAVTPAEVVYTLPTPGPAPTSTTIAVQALVGQDTIGVNIYDVSPAATASPNLLSTGTTTTTISPTALNTPSVAALGVPNAVILALDPGPSPTPTGVPSPGATARPWTPLENVSAAQTITIDATAVDALGYTITGPLATAVPVAATGPVTLSASSVTSGAATLTATYAANANTGGTIASSLNASGTNVVTVTPDYDIFVAGLAGGMSGTNAIETIDGVDEKSVAVLAGGNTADQVLASASCNGTAIAAMPGAGGLSIVTVVPPTNAAPIPQASLTTFALANIDTNYGEAFDASCNLYLVVGSASTSDVLTKVSGFGGTLTSMPLTTIAPLAGATSVVSGRLSAAMGMVYVSQYTQNPFAPTYGATYSVPTTGGSATMIGARAAESVVAVGSTLYASWMTTSSCNYAAINLQDLAATQTLQTSAQSGGTVNVGTALQAASDGTLYVGDPSSSHLRVASTPLTTWSTTTVNYGNGFALSPDPANTYVFDVNGGILAALTRSTLTGTATTTTIAQPVTALFVTAAP
jgi:hypothetical protein